MSAPSPAALRRRVVGNLLFESELARAFLPALSRVRVQPRSTQSRSALESAAAYGTLLRAFCREGDRLWLPAPLDPRRLLAAPGLPAPELEGGDLRLLEPAEETLAWGEAPSVAALRRKGGGCPGGEGAPAQEPEGELPLWEAVWRIPPAPPEVVARVHHRAFAQEVALAGGFALPGATMLASLGELDRHLAAGAAPRGAWVVKAPLSASGRDRFVERGARISPHFGEAATRRRIAALFARHGALAFEPWMERTADFGACALLTPSGLRPLGFHRLLVDLRGQFQGIEVGPGSERAGLTGEEAETLASALEAAGAALARAGYRGPFGLDAWRHRPPGGPEGALAFHPLGEINARLTFGFVARALGERLRAAGALSGSFRLLFGRSRGAHRPLVAAPDGPALAWIEPA